MFEVVLKDHEIPQKTAMQISVLVPSACDICFEWSCKVKTLARESSLNTVLEGNKTAARVVNTTATPVKLKQGVLFESCTAI